jgi:hypothetical protein
MVSQIDATKPSAPIAYTADMRANFAAAKNEISLLQTKTTGGPWLPLGGGELSGPLILFEDAALPSEAVTLQQLNAAIALLLPINGSVAMTGALTLSGNASQPQHAIPLQQMTTAIDAAPYLSLADGGTVSGNAFIDAVFAVTRGPLFIQTPHADSSPSLQISNDGSANTSWPTISLSKKGGAGMSTLISATTNGVPRFDIFLTDPFGADDFAIRCWDDAGTTAIYPLNIKRSTGLITVHGDPTDPLGIATPQYLSARMAARTFMQFEPAAPAATSDATGIMMGLAAAITPNVTGKVSIAVTGNVTASPAGAGCYIFLRYGTGTPPTYGAAAVGTTAGVAQFTSPAAGAVISFAKQVALNLTVGTAYWIDLGVTCYFGATASLTTLTITAVEQ